MTLQIPTKIRKLLASVKPANIRFIKLGAKSAWWRESKRTSTLRFGYREVDFDLCQAGDWLAARKNFEGNKPNLTQGAVTSHMNQVRDFFELPNSTLWITIEDGDIWWCFAELPVEDIFTTVKNSNSRGAKVRRLVDQWRNIDVLGRRLRIDMMTTRITKVSSFQGTICKPDGAADVLRIIRAEQSKARLAVSGSLAEFTRNLGELLEQLHQDDFELLVELIFSSSGWKRITSLGDTQKTWDLALTLPTTGENCFVQVKSQTTSKTFANIVSSFNEHTGYSKMFFVYHTPEKAFETPDESRVVVWSRLEVARQAINAGLVEWIIEHTT